MFRQLMPRHGYTTIEVLVVSLILGLLMALTLPAVQKVRGHAARAQCANHLRQVGLGLANYHTAEGRFPRGVGMPKTAGETMPHASWHTLLLPYVGQENLWNQAVEAYKAKPDDFRLDPVHPFANIVPFYGCPADHRTATLGHARDGTPVGLTSYLGVSGTKTSRKNGVFYRDSQTKLADVTDGASNTLLVGERPPSGDTHYGWWYGGLGSDGAGRGDMLLGVRDVAGGNYDPQIVGCPTDPNGFAKASLDNLCEAFQFWSTHPNGANFLFCDGAVRFLPYSADSIMPALATRAGGESVEVP